MATRILVVDDEPAIRELVRYNLENAGYEADEACTGNEALEKALSDNYDLLILDIMLPGPDGLEVCRQVRKISDVPILFLTARDEEVDRILGLEMGGDDYITKPFSPREMVARIRAILRRFAKGADTVTSSTMRAGNLELSIDRHEVLVDGDPVDLTPKEFDLIHLLLKNRGKTLTRDTLLQDVWGYEYAGGTRTLDVHIRRLRQKLGDDPQSPQYIQTVHGVGYKFPKADHNG